MQFKRLRQSRKTSRVRDLSAETKLKAQDLILPFFVVAGKNIRQKIPSFAQVNRLSVDNLIDQVKRARDLGIRSILLFGVAEKKDAGGSQAYSDTGVVQSAIKAIKARVKGVVVISDVCLCAYTVSGHCGIVKNKRIDNDSTLEILCKIALSHARAGVDFVAPSSMMDGQVQAIRGALNRRGFKDTKILGYSAKYASNFYAPFREALGSGPRFADRKTYQMDFRNSDGALREIEADIREGADMVMVKPALSYLDIIRRAKERFNITLAAYNVSGEYAMLKTYCRGRGAEKELVLEVLTGIKRAGADLIITYHAKEAAKWLKS